MNNNEAIGVITRVARLVHGKVFQGYSGRGMFGKQCYGVTCRIANEAIENAARLGLNGAKTDYLGHDYIVYWPSVVYTTEAK